MNKKSLLLLVVISFITQVGLLYGETVKTKVAVEDDDWKASSLRPGDTLSINVFRVEEFSRTVKIEEDGTFMYPLCGRIEAAGETPSKIASIITEKLAKQVSNPQVDVTVSEWASRPVYILGEVATSQSLALPTYGRMTALQAISAAGGFKESADLNNVAVLRRRANGRVERIQVDVSALVSHDSNADDFRLRPEDTLIVPKAPPVFVCGAVGTQSVMYVDTQRLPLCSEVIVRCGGLKTEADPENIRIIRRGAKGEIKILVASLHVTDTQLYANDVLIQPGDSVLVNEASKIYVLGQVNKPGALVLGPDHKTTVSEAIALAGGFTPSAKERDVSVIRGREIISVNMRNFYESTENMQNDIELRKGDILFVKESFF